MSWARPCAASVANGFPLCRLQQFFYRFPPFFSSASRGGGHELGRWSPADQPERGRRGSGFLLPEDGSVCLADRTHPGQGWLALHPRECGRKYRVPGSLPPEPREPGLSPGAESWARGWGGEEGLSSLSYHFWWSSPFAFTPS